MPVDAAASNSSELRHSKGILTGAEDPTFAHAQQQDQESWQDAPPPQPSGQIAAAPPTAFGPFFTMIEDATTGEHYHPHVHYIFSDDDPDVLTTSLIDAQSNGNVDNDTDHCLLLVDIGPDGRSVQSAHSLSGTWQVMESSLIPAPSWTTEAGRPGAASSSEGLMLKIAGASVPKPLRRDRKHGEQQQQRDAIQKMEDDVEVYAAQLRHLQHVLSKAAV